MLLDLDRLRNGLTAVLGSALAERERDLGRLRNSLRFVTPLKTVQPAERELRDYRLRLQRAAARRLEQLGERLANRRQALEAASPAHILARGYALVSDETGAIIRERAQVSRNQRLNVQLAKDRINVRVED